MRRIILAAFLTVAALPRVAHADLYGPPSGWTTGSPVVRIPANVFLGTLNAAWGSIPAGSHVVLGRRPDTNDCDGPYKIGTTTTISGGLFSVYLSNYGWPGVGATVGDSFETETSTMGVYCATGYNGVTHYTNTNFNIGPVATTNTAPISVYGGTAGDWIRCVSSNTSTTTHCYGNGGDDYVDSTQAKGTMSLEGGDGNDTVRNNSAYGAGSLTLTGGAGNDCIRTDTGPVTVDCGSGTDTVSVGQSSTNCETAVNYSSCP
jgi:Ca2+-binding RTX toxin-like protein